jgi:hypothetical protein
MSVLGTSRRLNDESYLTPAIIAGTSETGDGSWSVDYGDSSRCGYAAARTESKKRDLMSTNKASTAPTWSEVKAKLALFDRAGLVGLLSDSTA